MTGGGVRAYRGGMATEMESGTAAPKSAAPAAAGLCPVASGSTTPAPVRSPADQRMRRLLRIPDRSKACPAGAQNAFSKSVFISAARCLLTYVVLPIMGPVVGLTGSVGPSLGLVVGAVSMVAIGASIRRFFAADHRWRWRYTLIGGSILVLLTAQAVIDIADLAG